MRRISTLDAASARAVSIVLALSFVWGCSAFGSRDDGDEGSSKRSATAPSASAVSASASASGVVSAAARAPAPPPVDAAKVAASVTGACRDSDDVFIAVSPREPAPSQPLKAFVVSADRASAPDGVVAIAPNGAADGLASELRFGPPASAYAELRDVREGTYRLIAHKDARAIACKEIEVVARAKAPRTSRGSAPWPVERPWTRPLEDLYSVWIEKLFDAPVEEQPSFSALHDVTRDARRNFFHGYLALDEDEPSPIGLRLDPDCADLPYFLRAYFAFKMGLPFGFSSCTRGGAGRAPKCLKRGSSIEAMDDRVRDRVRRFEHFMRVRLKDTVHSGTGRTLATDDYTDYYPIRLADETLRPGAIYADPFGHILVVAKRVPQTGDTAGILFAIDGQPDGTVARKRFWRGNFLFANDEPAMGSPGFKRFRPVVLEGGDVRPLKNAEIAADGAYGDYGTEQSEGDPTRFYDRMDDIISPAPLDPERALLEVVTALEEQMKARVTSVKNGDEHFSKGGGRIDMPDGASIFETTGDWENYSTPSRDLRLLIAIDVVRGFPSKVERRPERFMMPAGKSKADVVKDLEALLATETSKRKVTYPRSDGSPFELSLADVLSRAESLEMTYNPNDCPELRWGAAQGSAEASTCRRRAPGDQRRKMEKVRGWFRERKRPPRG